MSADISIDRRFAHQRTRHIDNVTDVALARKLEISVHPRAHFRQDTVKTYGQLGEPLLDQAQKFALDVPDKLFGAIDDFVAVLADCCSDRLGSDRVSPLEFTV